MAEANIKQTDNFDETLVINPDDFITNGRQIELIEVAQAGLIASALRQAIRETVFAVRTQMLKH